MKFDSDVQGLLKGVVKTSLLLFAVEAAIGIVLCAAGLFHLEMTPLSVLGIVLGAAGGTAIAVFCFWWMCASLQKSLDAAAAGKAEVKRGVQAGYFKRLMVQGIWVAIAAFVPVINTISGLVPLLFPKMAIYLLQITGKLNLTQQKPKVKGGES